MITVIVGPTGVGKTKLSIELAKHFQTEIISGDSVQVYKRLNIGSAKATTKEQEGIKHHLIDIIEPSESFSVAIYQKLVRDKISEFESNKMVPLIVGGTGLYIKSVLYDYNFDETRRDESKLEQFKDYTNEALHNVLQEKDPTSAQNIHMNNRKRVLQALNRSDSNKVSDNTSKDIKKYEFQIIGLTKDRAALYSIINDRVDRMFEDGLENEVRALYDEGFDSYSLSAIGYKELIKYFEGEWTLEEAKAKIKQHSRNLAKKQFTFFNNQFDIQWVEVDLDNFDNTLKEVLQLLQ